MVFGCEKKVDQEIVGFRDEMDALKRELLELRESSERVVNNVMKNSEEIRKIQEIDGMVKMEIDGELGGVRDKIDCMDKCLDELKKEDEKISNEVSKKETKA